MYNKFQYSQMLFADVIMSGYIHQYAQIPIITDTDLIYYDVIWFNFDDIHLNFKTFYQRYFYPFLSTTTKKCAFV